MLLLSSQLILLQKFRSTGYASFSFFGLLFTYVSGGVIIILSYIIEPILSYLQRRYRYAEYAHLEWTANSTFQLHRLAHEDPEQNRWAGCTDTIPTTKTDVLLSGLHIDDVNHPRLRLEPFAGRTLSDLSQNYSIDQKVEHKQQQNRFTNCVEVSCPVDTPVEVRHESRLGHEVTEQQLDANRDDEHHHTASSTMSAYEADTCVLVSTNDTGGTKTSTEKCGDLV